MGITPDDMMSFITGRATEEVKRRIAEDLSSPDSYARKVLDGMAASSHAGFEKLLCDLDGNLHDDTAERTS